MKALVGAFNPSRGLLRDCENRLWNRWTVCGTNSDYTFPCNNCRALVGAIIRTEACQPDEIVSAPDSLAYTQRNIFDKFYQYFSLCCGLGQVNRTCLLLILLLYMVFLDILQNLHYIVIGLYFFMEREMKRSPLFMFSGKANSNFPLPHIFGA